MTVFLPAPRRRRAYFMLTPLVDVMFLLLIFFMLSSETSLYTLMRMSAQGVAATDDASSSVASIAELIVSIGHQQVRLNGEVVLLDQLPGVLDRYKAQGLSRAALVAGQAAQVQDIVSVLELFEAAAFGEVRLIDGGGRP